jgi:hypothetical protein
MHEQTTSVGEKSTCATKSGQPRGGKTQPAANSRRAASSGSARIALICVLSVDSYEAQPACPQALAALREAPRAIALATRRSEHRADSSWCARAAVVAAPFPARVGAPMTRGSASRAKG